MLMMKKDKPVRYTRLAGEPRDPVLFFYHTASAIGSIAVAAFVIWAVLHGLTAQISIYVPAISEQLLCPPACST